jgi:hypothetical protein
VLRCWNKLARMGNWAINSRNVVLEAGSVILNTYDKE